MKTYIEERAMEIARYIIDNNTTVRQADETVLGLARVRYIKMLQNALSRSIHRLQRRHAKC